jgi:Porin PorA
VEPATGIIDAEQQLRQVLETPGGEQVLTQVDAALGWDDATVKANADDTTSAASQLRLLGTILPVGSALLGLVLIVIALTLMRHRRAQTWCS